MSHILFIRHAETDMAGTFCGHSDPEINSRGQEQISELIERLRVEDIDTVYTSDLRRAQTTARAVATAFGVECHVRTALREISFGQWEGLTWNEIERQDKGYANRWLSEYPSLPAPDGEAFREFEERIVGEVAFLSQIAVKRSIAVVTHAGVLRILVRSFHRCSEKDAWRQTEPYCAIVRHAVASSSQTQVAEVYL